VDPTDPARAELARLLTKRDGTDAGMGALVQSKREAGGDEAPTFTLEDRGGASVDLASLRGKVVLIGFWSYG
jgi:cytochrome oxidase Cu insertion factor (SCO1/SenC/PrrC family)